MPDQVPDAVPRRAGAEHAIGAALVGLLVERRYDAVRVGEIAARAGVARSTFYEHFRNKDDVLVAALAPLLLALATAASGSAARSYVRGMVDHLWRNRALTRPLLGSAAAPLVQRRLAATIATIPAYAGRPGTHLTAAGIAAAQLAMLRDWLSGRVPASMDQVTDHLIGCSRLWRTEQPVSGYPAMNASSASHA